MRVIWSPESRRDMKRLHAFLAPVNPRAAMDVIRQIVSGVRQLQSFPALGARLDIFESHEVRRFVVGDYEIRYQVAGDTMRILRLWSAREDR